MNTVTNEQSNLEKAVTSSLSNVPGEYTRDDWLGYYIPCYGFGGVHARLERPESYESRNPDW